MSNFISQNNKLAIKQLKYIGPSEKRLGGVAIMSQRAETVTTELLFDAEIDRSIILAGSQIAFLGDAAAQPWNKHLISHDGVEFVLAPYDQVLLVGDKKPAETGV